MAERVWIAAVVAIFVTVLMTGAFDLSLILHGSGSITDFLRGKPRYFWWPFTLAVLFFAWLIWHLYG